MLIALCHSTCFCSCQCSTTIMKRMKQATLIGFLVLNMLIILCQSDWFASHQTVGLQEWFVQVNQRVLKQKILWRLQTQGGVASHPIHPPPWISHCITQLDWEGGWAVCMQVSRSKAILSPRVWSRWHLNTWSCCKDGSSNDDTSTLCPVAFARLGLPSYFHTASKQAYCRVKRGKRFWTFPKLSTFRPFHFPLSLLQ